MKGIPTINPEYRRPVGVTSDRLLNGALVVCDDGAVFYLRIDGAWEEHPPLPGSPRDAGLCVNGDEPR